MTTAHRPTYNPTKGGNRLLTNPSLQHSSRDMPANMNIKYREEGQGTSNEIKHHDFKSELLKRERDYISNEEEDLFYPIKKAKVDQTHQRIPQSESIQQEQPEFLIQQHQEQEQKEEEIVFPQDKDVSYSDDGEKDNDDIYNNNSNNSLKQNYDSDSLDSEEELLIELEKIKQHQKKEKERKEMELKEKTQNEILKRNPLLNQNTNIEDDYADNSYSHNDYSLKRKWYEDSIFKNQSKLDQKVQKRFINDTVRSDFHRKFLSKTIQ